MAEKNYDDLMLMISSMAEVSKQNTENASVILQKLDSHDTLLNGLSNSMANTNAKLESMRGEIDQLKFNEEITTDQHNKIRNSAHRRVYSLIGEDQYSKDHYFGTFVKRLYADMRRNYGLGPQIERTKKRDYDRIMEGIENWYPYGGVKALMAEIDKREEERKRYRELI